MTDTAHAAWRKYSAMVQAAQNYTAPLPHPGDAEGSSPRERDRTADRRRDRDNAATKPGPEDADSAFCQSDGSRRKRRAQHVPEDGPWGPAGDQAGEEGPARHRQVPRRAGSGGTRWDGCAQVGPREPAAAEHRSRIGPRDSAAALHHSWSGTRELGAAGERAWIGPQEPVAASGPHMAGGLEGAAEAEEHGEEQTLFDTVGAVTLACNGGPPPWPSPLGTEWSSPLHCIACIAVDPCIASEGLGPELWDVVMATTMEMWVVLGEKRLQWEQRNARG